MTDIKKKDELLLVTVILSITPQQHRTLSGTFMSDISMTVAKETPLKFFCVTTEQIYLIFDIEVEDTNFGTNINSNKLLITIMKLCLSVGAYFEAYIKTNDANNILIEYRSGGVVNHAANILYNLCDSTKFKVNVEYISLENELNTNIATWIQNHKDRIAKLEKQ